MNENRYQQCGEQNWFLILVAFESQINFSCKLCSGEFFKKVYEHMTAHAKIVVPFIAQMETSDASIGTAFAKQQ